GHVAGRVPVEIDPEQTDIWPLNRSREKSQVAALYLALDRRFDRIDDTLSGVLGARPSWSRRRPAFRRAKRSAPHRQQMEAERCATANTSDLHYIFSHSLTLQYERDAVSGKLAVSTFLALPTQRNLHTGA